MYPAEQRLNYISLTINLTLGAMKNDSIFYRKTMLQPINAFGEKPVNNIQELKPVSVSPSYRPKCVAHLDLEAVSS